MFKLKENQTHKFVFGNGKDHYSSINSNEFNINKYILEKYNSIPSSFYSDEKFSNDILDFLIKNGKFIRSSIVGKISFILNNLKNFRGGSFWFEYKDIYLKISVNGQEDEPDVIFDISGKNDKKYSNVKKYDLTIIAPSHVQDYHFEDFKSFIIEETGSKIHLFIKNQYGDYDFEPIKVDLPENMNLELNYGKEFLNIDKLIRERLTSHNNGIFMFHGKPGTGKTTYIKYLASKVPKDFIYVPTTMIESFTSDPNCLSILLTKPNSVLVLEDAEKAILKRHGDEADSSNVSSLLNLSDGILNNILKTSVILTYNCSKNQIDSALRRKGRLQADYEFKLLEVDEAKKLAKHLKYSKKTIEMITEPISIADLYYLEVDVDFSEHIKNEKNERVIGFAQS